MVYSLTDLDCIATLVKLILRCYSVALLQVLEPDRTKLPLSLTHCLNTFSFCTCLCKVPHSENRVLIRLDPVSKSRESPFYFHFHRLTSESVCAAGVGCNCGRHAILSASDTSAYAIVSGAMQKPSGGHVHVCARISERACTEPNNMQHEYSRYL